MIKKYKHMRENFVDDYFADVLNEEDDIWDDDTYVGEDSDIHKTNIADSDDDLPEDFFDVDDDFDEDDFIDVEEPEYWENSKEIDPNDYDLKNNSSAASNWSKLASEEDLNDDTFTPDEHLEDYTNAINKSIDPAHSDSFRKIMNLDGMEESKKMPRSRLKESAEEWDSEGYDDFIFDGDMEDWDWESYNDKYGGTNPHKDMEHHLADCFPTRDSEYQDDEGNYDPFTFTQMGDGKGGLGKRTKAAAYADHLGGGDNAIEIIDDDGKRTVSGGIFDGDETDIHDEDFAMSDDANLDAWVRESKKVMKSRLKEDTAFICTNKPKDEKRDLPEWVYQRFGKIYESYNK